MQITAKSKKNGHNRIDAIKSENNQYVLPNKMTNHNNVIKEGIGKGISNKQKRIQRFSLINNLELDELNSFSISSKTNRENYYTKDERLIMEEKSIIDEHPNYLDYERYKFRKKEIVLLDTQQGEKVIKKPKSFDDFMNRRHKEKISNVMTNKNRTYAIYLTSAKIKTSPYEFYSNLINTKNSREFNLRDTVFTNNKRTKGNFLSTDFTNSHLTNNLVNNFNIKHENLNNKLPNNSYNTSKLNPLSQNQFKSNLKKFEKIIQKDKYKKEIDTKHIYQREKINSPLVENIQLNNSKNINVYSWEKRKFNDNYNSNINNHHTNLKTSNISQKLQSLTPNLINNTNSINRNPNINYPVHKEQDIFNKISGKSNIKNIIDNVSSSKKISIRKISTNSIRNENENNIDYNSNHKTNTISKNYKRNSDTIASNNNIIKTNSKNRLANVINGIPTPDSTFHSKSPISQIKIKEKYSNHKSDKKEDLLNVTLKQNKYKDIPKFSLKMFNEKITDKTENSTIKNFGVSTEIEKTITTPDLSTELTDKTFKGLKKEELSPFRIYQIERFEDNVDNISEKYITTSPIEMNDNPTNMSNKNINQLSNLEQIINNNLNYLNHNTKNINHNDDPNSPPQEMVRTKKFTYSDLTPMYSTNNPSKPKITDDFLNRIEKKKIVVDDLKLTFLQNGDYIETQNNLKVKINNYDNNTSLIQISSDELDNSSSERIDLLDEINQLKINNPIISKIKKNSFAINFIDDELPFSDDEKKQTMNVPIFKSRKLVTNAKNSSNFYKNFSKAQNVQNITLERVFDLYILKNSKLKESLLSYLTYKDLSNLCCTTKLYRKEFKNILTEKIIKTIISNDSKEFHQKIWRSIFHYSKLSSVKYLRKEFLDNLFKKSKYEEEIRKDLLRTIPEDPTFQPGKENYKKLFNILFAYSNFNKKIGYAQGINFMIANSLFIFQKEEEAFVFIDAMVNKLKLYEIIGIDEIAINYKLESVGKLIEKHTPKIVKYLAKNFLNHEFFTTGWIIPLFSNSIKKEILFILWDFLFIYGWNFFYYFIVSILCVFENKILEADPNRLSVFIKNLLKSEQFEKHFDKIIYKTFEILNNSII